MKKQFYFFMAIMLLLAACNNPLEEAVNIRITYFAFEGLTPVAEGSIDNETCVITVYVPMGCNLENLNPTIKTAKGCELRNAPGNNFSQPVRLTVSDGRTDIAYIVYVHEEIIAGEVLKVGKDKTCKTVAEAAAQATDNCTVEIDAGTYAGDVARWRQNNLMIRAVGGDVVLDANGKNIGGVGIWEINGGRIRVEGITFKNAKVPDRNGAGIRLTKGDLTLINCRFLNNETGVLTANDGVSTLTVRNCEFGYNGYGDGYSHNLYAGYIAKLSVTGCYFHHADVGHLLKSRAALNMITCNRITDENDGQSQASYELDFPSGGQAVVTGNIIQQSKNTENPIIISFAKEGFNHYTDNELYLCYNTVVNSRTQNDLVVNAPVSPSIRIVAYNNLLSGNTYFNPQIQLYADEGNVLFKQGDLNDDYSPTIQAYNEWNSKVEPDIDNSLSTALKTMGISLIPAMEYKHPLEVKPFAGTPAIPGALQSAL
jgi:hypothetical protein